jgi:histidinol-phosphate aminotransferase
LPAAASSGDNRRNAAIEQATMHLANPNLPLLEPYTPGLSREYVAARYGIPPERIAKLGSAENPFGPSPLGARAVQEAMARLSLYPDWTGAELREAVARRYGLDPRQIFCGAGETEIISWILRLFAGPGEAVLMHEPTFPIYHLAAEAEGRVPRFVPMGEEFSWAEDAFIAALAAPDVRIAFLTSPHSPTGKVVPLDFVARICEAAGLDRPVVLDEAYWHFAETASGMELLARHPNLIVLRTFSKAYGLAGLRVGFGVAAPALAELFLRLKPTWNLGPLQTAGAGAALGDDAHVERTVRMIAEMRSYFFQHLGRFTKVSAVPGSRSNFFLLRVDDPALDSTGVFEHLLSRGVIAKDCSVSFRGLGKRYLRVDISLKENMDRLLDALDSL